MLYFQFNFKKNHGFIVNHDNPSEKALKVEEELYDTDIDEIGNLEN